MDDHLRKLTAEALDALPMGVWIADRAGKILWRNAPAKEMLGDGASVADVFRFGADAPADASGLLPAETSQEGRWRGVSLEPGGGRRLTADLWTRPIGNGTVLIVAQDASNRITMERRAAAAQRADAERKLTARVAHELNNPLDGVMRYVNLARREAHGKAGQYLEGASAGLARMAEFVRRLLDEAGGAPGSRQRSAAELLNEAIVAMRPRAEALGVAIACDTDDAASVSAPTAVFEVFCNVIRNALDAMATGGLLGIRLFGADAGCRIEFADTGCGISPADAEAIFRPFHTTKKPHEGLGLGLTISREIIERAGGWISAGQRDGGGTVVTVHLPAPANRRER